MTAIMNLTTKTPLHPLPILTPSTLPYPNPDQECVIPRLKALCHCSQHHPQPSTMGSPGSHNLTLQQKHLSSSIYFYTPLPFLHFHWESSGSCFPPLFYQSSFFMFSRWLNLHKLSTPPVIYKIPTHKPIEKAKDVYRAEKWCMRAASCSSRMFRELVDCWESKKKARKLLAFRPRKD